MAETVAYATLEIFPATSDCTDSCYPDGSSIISNLEYPTLLYHPASMDPVTLIGPVEGSFSLTVQCGSVTKRLNNIAGQLKYAKLTVSTMVQNLDIMQLAWDRIRAWSKDFMLPDNDAFTQRLERFLETGSLVLDALDEDLRSYDVSSMNFTRLSRLVWNETLLQGHQSGIRNQAQSMSLLLQAIQL